MKIGVIGLGSIGRRHANNLMEMGHTVYGYDPPLQREGMKINGLKSASLGDLINKSEAVVIASPSKFHKEHLIRVLQHKKPVFVEKPIATDLNDLTLALRIAEVPIMVGNNLRLHECVIKAKRWIYDGKIGRQVWANFIVAQHTEKSPYLRDGVTLNWGAHEIDLALHLLGPAKVTAASIDKDDTIADILLLHDNGCRTTVHLDYLTKREIRRFSIQGDKSLMESSLTTRWVGLADETIFNGWGSFDQDYKDEMQAFIDRIDGKETLGATGEDGLETLKICLEARRMAGL